MQNQTMFYQWLENYPLLAHCWNKETHELDSFLLNRIIGETSGQMQALAIFFGKVWYGEKRFSHSFDLYQHIQCLDEAALSIIQHWLQAPFYLHGTIIKNDYASDTSENFILLLNAAIKKEVMNSHPGHSTNASHR